MSHDPITHFVCLFRFLKTMNKKVFFGNKNRRKNKQVFTNVKYYYKYWKILKIILFLVWQSDHQVQFISFELSIKKPTNMKGFKILTLIVTFGVIIAICHQVSAHGKYEFEHYIVFYISPNILQNKWYIKKRVFIVEKLINTYYEKYRLYFFLFFFYRWRTKA